MAYSALRGLSCPQCGAGYDADRVMNLCACGSPLLAEYDLGAVGETVTPEVIGRRPPTLWRYHELLPVRDPDNVLTLGEGMTPLVPLPRLGAEYGVPRLLMKDEGLVPTGSFKARGAAVGASRARELGVKGIAMPTNGNAGAAWATYATRGGLRSLITMPLDAPVVTRRECLAAGAELYLVNGHIGQCGQLIGAALESRPGFQDVSTLKEPYRVEGKKTMGLELVEQLGWRVPDVIVYPTGGGVGLIGIRKALRELQELGWIGDRLPRLVAVQASGCAPIVAAFAAGATRAQAWPDPHTVAFGLTVPKPLGDALILEALYATEGTAIAVDDEDTLAEQTRCARLEGALLCPEGAATLAAVRRLRESGWLRPDDEVVVLNTGAGIKYPDTVSADAPVLEPDGAIP
ncbi:threonine synthase [Actinophytocola sp.]|uniref:threonine synthase n=1 Tax=Actinophytocola sp. TaxID=1872138 RepID=UPI002D7FB90E|nr:threonine synthase [Actinophytocola sp.]HET9139877.1 threonine synthase [Actinophytocola sp.]